VLLSVLSSVPCTICKNKDPNGYAYTSKLTMSRYTTECQDRLAQTVCMCTIKLTASKTDCPPVKLSKVSKTF